jgi:hypothetical protein
MAPAKSDIVVALTSGYYGVNGEEVVVHAGQHFRTSDPVVKKFPAHFTPLLVGDERVEQATAEPGQKRG